LEEGASRRWREAVFRRSQEQQEKEFLILLSVVLLIEGLRVAIREKESQPLGSRVAIREKELQLF